MVRGRVGTGFHDSVSTLLGNQVGQVDIQCAFNVIVAEVSTKSLIM